MADIECDEENCNAKYVLSLILIVFLKLGSEDNNDNDNDKGDDGKKIISDGEIDASGGGEFKMKDGWRTIISL